MSRFLTAEWRHLLMLNYAVEPELLQPYVPAGVELESWNGKTFASMVGFLFLRTKVLGVRVPGHGNFEEVNLRFYVRRKAPEGWRRGVVFIKEIVPRRLIANVARICYNEPYAAMPMRNRVDETSGLLQSGSLVEYGWQFKGRWNSLDARVEGLAQPLVEGSEEESITEHYWGYTAQRNGGCKEYKVEHERWNVWQTREAKLDCDIASLYGVKFLEPLSARPHSAFVAEGSSVAVSTGVTI